MDSFISNLVPESVKKLIPYQSARRIGGAGRIWLNANELEHPISDLTQGAYNRYPDFLPQDVCTAYQDYCHTKQPTVAVRGADEAIDLLIRTFCQPAKDQILISSPTYAMYEFCAESLAIGVNDVPLKDNFQLDVPGIIQKAADVNLIFICSPNNPTGNAIAQQDLIAVLKGADQQALVVVDEAYIEFDHQDSAISLMEQYPHLIVIRTLSKAFGLAAVRCGFILASAEVMQYVAKLIPPYPMPDSSSQLVLEALSISGLAKVAVQVSEIKTTRSWFMNSLQRLDCIEQVYASSTNFVLLKNAPQHDLFQVLLDDGIVTRNQHHEPALRNCVRITIGSQVSMQAVIDTLTEYQRTCSNKNV